MGEGNIVIRADASPAIGSGHVMRCLALAQAWQDRGGTATFLAASVSPALKERIVSGGFGIRTVSGKPGSRGDATETAGYAKKGRARWIVADGYHFGTGYQKTLRGAGLSVLFLDDCGHAGRYVSDIVLNQNAYADRNMYTAREPYTRLLLGTNYALLRREFAQRPKRKHRIAKTAKKILVTMGGSDPDNVTGKIVRALQQIPKDRFSARVISGGDNPHRDSLRSQIAESPGHRIALLENVGDMAEQAAWADLAVTGGGSTTLELACMGVPMLVTEIAGNQEQNCAALGAAGAAVSLGRPTGRMEKDLPRAIQEILEDRDRRASLSEKAGALVDGRGAGRVAECLAQPASALRKAVPADCRTVYRWATDPHVREVSFSRGSIGWDEHRHWFLSKIADPDVFYCIVTGRDEKPVGQVRFDIRNGEATISVTIGARNRGKGMGAAAIERSSRCFFNSTGVNTIHAFVKRGNPASYRAFLKAGFECRDEIRVGDDPAYHLVMQR